MAVLMELSFLPTSARSRFLLAAAALSLVVGLIYYFTAPEDSPFDYTFRVATAFLEGHLEVPGQPLSWLNEMVYLPDRDAHTSVFPLGAVLSMLPVAVVQKALHHFYFPSALVGACLGAIACWFACLLAAHWSPPDDERPAGGRPLLLAAALMLGTWTWGNLVFGGAWQIALGVALVGELGALYFTSVRRMPLVAGAFFAVAFGNRTEILLLFPIFLFLLWRDASPRLHKLIRGIEFVIVPFILGVATLLYNHARFGAFSQFGYDLIPGVLQEPWYNHGIFALALDYWQRNAFHMFAETGRTLNHFPWITPSPWGGCVLLYSPFLLELFLPARRDRGLLISCWLAMAILIFMLFSHGNPGGWQVSYRYAIPLLPWVLLLLAGMRIRYPRIEVTLIVLSILINAYATVVFGFTKLLTP